MPPAPLRLGRFLSQASTSLGQVQDEFVGLPGMATEGVTSDLREVAAEVLPALREGAS
jgi:hypothetical protein